MHMGAVRELILQRSEDLLCRNLMCERVGEACVCRFSMVLEKLPQLKALNVSHNHLHALPPSLFNLPQLEELNLGHNNLSDTALVGLEGLQSLRHLDLSHNQLTSAPSTLALLPYIQVIDLRGNPKLNLRSLPSLPAHVSLLHE
ncbi:hypothetical protein DYB37_005955 [Aphanomyces astaci]|nr:hypothetical protein DYB25_007553 [Aphanomyces astaci]RHY48177.1 hypothetical protein DYB30_001864 [Aphanomyces astaci]RHY61156.1 hypothetical protein DYB38_001568 [Aphanomyces astaci]RHY91168.1 hypothetical protein DYB35_003593 [Aphanomyces astaci]RHZ33214.1 hypothetical protein DYB37_005955 [Aphanomyces astaci]